MAEDHEALIQDIAAKHGVVLDRHDPLLMLQTVLARLQDDQTKAQHALLAEFHQKGDALLQQWGVDVNKKAERVILASVTASIEAMKNELAASVSETASAIRKEVAGALEQATDRLQTAERMAYWNLFAALVTFLATVVLYWTLRP